MADGNSLPPESGRIRGLNGMKRKALYIDVLPVYVIAGVDRRDVNDSSDVKTNRRRASASRFLSA